MTLLDVRCLVRESPEASSSAPSSGRLCVPPTFITRMQPAAAAAAAAVPLQWGRLPALSSAELQAVLQQAAQFPHQQAALAGAQQLQLSSAPCASSAAPPCSAPAAASGWRPAVRVLGFTLACDSAEKAEALAAHVASVRSKLLHSRLKGLQELQ